jgi:hypothetical protein
VKRPVGRATSPDPIAVDFYLKNNKAGFLALWKQLVSFRLTGKKPIAKCIPFPGSGLES